MQEEVGKWSEKGMSEAQSNNCYPVLPDTLMQVVQSEPLWTAKGQLLRYLWQLLPERKLLPPQKGSHPSVDLQPNLGVAPGIADDVNDCQGLRPFGNEGLGNAR